MAKHIGKHAKVPRSEFKPILRKRPRIGKTGGTDHERVRWCFEIFDHHDWSAQHEAAVPFLDVCSHLKTYSQRAWNEVCASRKRDHTVAIASLTPAARQRLITLEMDDLDELVSFRFTGRQRLWGIRDGEFFRVLWWDPCHVVCPALLKHT